MGRYRSNFGSFSNKFQYIVRHTKRLQMVLVVHLNWYPEPKRLWSLYGPYFDLRTLGPKVKFWKFFKHVPIYSEAYQTIPNDVGSWFELVSSAPKGYARCVGHLSTFGPSGRRSNFEIFLNKFPYIVRRTKWLLMTLRVCINQFHLSKRL